MTNQFVKPQTGPRHIRSASKVAQNLGSSSATVGKTKELLNLLLLRTCKYVEYEGRRTCNLRGWLAPGRQVLRPSPEEVTATAAGTNFV